MMQAAVAKQFDRAVPRRLRWVEVGDRAGKTITLPSGTLRSIELHLMDSGFGANSMDQILGTIPELFRVAAESKLRVSAVPVPHSNVEVAWGRVENGRKLVLTI